MKIPQFFLDKLKFARLIEVALFVQKVYLNALCAARKILTSFYQIFQLNIC